MQTYRRRALAQRPGRLILTVMSIVIGVAATVAVMIITQTTRGAYKAMFATITGRASLEVASDGANGMDESLVDEIQSIPGVSAAVPMIRRLSVLRADDRKGGETQKVRLQVLGIDPERDRAVRDYVLKDGRMLEAGDEVMLDTGFAKSRLLKVGDSIRLLTPTGNKELTVVGLWEPKGGSALEQAGLVYMTLSRAQSVFRAKDKVDAIHVVTTEGGSTDSVRERIAAILPTGVDVHPPAAQTQLMQETLFSSEQGLKITSVFSVLLACFIILNTFLMNVGERRRQLAILRAIGAERWQIIGSILGEAVLLGVLGVVIGIGAGMLGAYFLNRTISNVFDVPLAALELSWTPFALATLVGFGMALVGAIVPAIRASHFSPLEGMDRVSRADLKGTSVWFFVGGGTLIVISLLGIAGVVAGKVPLVVDIYLGVGLLVGIVLAYEIVLVPMARLVVWSLRPLLGVEGRLALKQILRHRVRSFLTAGVMFIAASTGVGMAYSIMDNVTAITDWYNQAIVGDFFIRAALPDPNDGTAPDLPAAMDPEIRAVPHLRSLEAVSFKKAMVGELGIIVIAREFPESSPMPFDLVEGDMSGLRDKLLDGQAVIGTVLAQRIHLGMGDEIELKSSIGEQKLKICGIANDYMVGGLSLYVHRPVAERLLKIQGADGYVIRVEPEHLETVREQLNEICMRHSVLLHSFADISRTIDKMIHGIDASLWGLVALEFFVAAFGIINTLTMNVLEQTRELALLRIVAMTRLQVRGTIYVQALILGIAGLVPGVAAGVLLAYLMNILTMPTIGHPIAFGSHPGLVVLTLLGSLLITMFAATFPAQRASRVDVAQALHYE